MRINSRLEALHTLCEIRRMELADEDATREGAKRWDALLTACADFFGDTDPVFNRFYNGYKGG